VLSITKNRQTRANGNGESLAGVRQKAKVSWGDCRGTSKRNRTKPDGKVKLGKSERPRNTPLKNLCDHTLRGA